MAAVILVVTWVFAFVLTLPFLIFPRVTTIHQQGQTFTFCHHEFNPAFPKRIYLLTFVLIVYIIPGIIITKNYFSVWRTVRRSAKNVHRSTNRQLSRTQVRLAHMLIWVIVLYVLMWTPGNIMLVLRSTNRMMSSTIFNATILISMANSAVNPILYGYFNSNFKEAFQKLMCCCCCCKKSRVGSQAEVPNLSLVSRLQTN